MIFSWDLKNGDVLTIRVVPDPDTDDINLVGCNICGFLDDVCSTKSTLYAYAHALSHKPV